MRFTAFLADCRKQWPAFDRSKQLEQARHPSDRRLAELPRQVEGMTVENLLMLLNLAAANLDPGEVYVEIGSWRGLTLSGAAAGNSAVPIYACDNFSQFGGDPERLAEALERHTAPGQVRFWNTDYREFLRRAPWCPARVGAF